MDVSSGKDYSVNNLNGIKGLTVDYNTILRSLRYALKINDQKVSEIFALNGSSVDAGKVSDMLKKEGDDGFLLVDEKMIRDFLDGLIISKRGPREPGSKALPDQTMNNNMVMKKIRIAFELKEEDMIKVIQDGGFVVSKAELTALFRKKGHKHYRECGDQLLRYFLKGLSNRDL